MKNNKAYKVDDVIWNTAGGVMAANLLLDDIENALLNSISLTSPSMELVIFQFT